MGCIILCRAFHTAPNRDRGWYLLSPLFWFRSRSLSRYRTQPVWLHHECSMSQSLRRQTDIQIDRQTDRQTDVPLSCWRLSRTRRTRQPGTAPRWRRIHGSPRTPQPPAPCRMQRVRPCSTAPGQEISHSINHLLSVTCCMQYNFYFMVPSLGGHFRIRTLHFKVCLHVSYCRR